MMFMRQQNQRQSVENSAAGKTLNNCVNKRQKSESIANWHEVRISELWWERVDSNHRSYQQQIYSLPPLAARELSHILMELVDGLEPPTC